MKHPTPAPVVTAETAQMPRGEMNVPRFKSPMSERWRG
jgi:hypothetical protein